MDMMGAPEIIAGRYEIVQPLDSGGMGMVHRAYDAVLDRVVAVKRIRYAPDSGTEARVEMAARFRREARVTAKIDHPGVPVVYDAAIDRSRLFLVMQLIEGVSLFDLLNEHDGPLPVDWAVAIAAQIATVLSYAHAVPVVHRDLKPRNIMIAQDGSVKVLDFGIAAVLRTDVTKITVTGGVIGTHGYMAPQQIRGGGVSPRSDLYGLGCLLHELLAGKRPFDHENTYELMRLHVAEPPLPVRVHAERPEIPEELERLILDLLEKDSQAPG